MIKVLTSLVDGKAALNAVNSDSKQGYGYIAQWEYITCMRWMMYTVGTPFRRVDSGINQYETRVVVRD